MRNLYKLFGAMLLLANVAVQAQIQKISYTTADNQVLKLNRISPASSRQPNRITLDGTWQFSTDINSLPADKNIQVPGEWVMQGFEVKRNVFAGYKRSFEIPADWKGKRIKLRFDAVYSEAEIWVNGKMTASHLGGFTPFEVDVNDFIKWNGSNDLLVKVKSESKADSLASGSTYAIHSLGGIPRKVYLVAVAPINFAYADVKTILDKNYENSILNTDVIIANEQDGKASNVVVKAELFKADGAKVGEKTANIEKGINKGDFVQQNISFDVVNPAKWDPEHPNLYVVKLSIIQDGKLQDAITKNIGFRQIEVRGNRVFVNNMPIKLRGVCRHEVMPLRGRSVNDNTWEKDVKLFIDGNVNYIRTSHYPPAEELIEACDRLGMFLEVEAPFCWADRARAIPAGTELYQTILVDQTMDMVNYFRSSPSVLIWSIANESNKYKEYFKETAKLVKDFDPTRPRNFSQWTPNADDGEMEIANHHYPGPTGPAVYNNYKRPIVFDEYVHLNAYNRLELVTDPGVRDAWGIGFLAMWEDMYKTDAVLGGAIWAGIDDTFFLPNGKVVGYGTWGPIDGWRREKPEYWHMKKAYSPVRIELASNWSNGDVALTLENRLLFSNLNECRIEWSLGSESGRITTELKRNKSTTVNVAVNKKPLSKDKMIVKVYDPRGVLVDIYEFSVVPGVKEVTEHASTAGQSWSYIQKGSILTAKNASIEVKFNLSSGDVEQVTKGGKSLWNTGARLMVLPLTPEGRGIQMTGGSQEFDPFTDVCKGRIVKNITLNKAKNGFTVSVSDSYLEAVGVTTYNFMSDGQVKVSYKYTILKAVNPRQWGLVFGLPDTFQELDWNRNALWNYYPADHIGRSYGRAKLMSEVKVSGPAGPGALPTKPWSQDRSELGTNDFRSTKMYIYSAFLTNGVSTFDVMANGQQHIRAWKDSQNIKALIAGYSNMGAGDYFRDHAAKMDRPLKVGDVIQDNIVLKLR